MLPLYRGPALLRQGRRTRRPGPSALGRSALRDLQERFHLLVEAVDEYAIYMLDPEGRVMTWNQGAARLKGYAAEEVIGRNFAVFYTPEEMAAGRPARNLADAAANGTLCDQGWRLRKDGTRFWANMTLTALFDEDGSLRGFAKITRDETQRIAADQHVRELELLNERERIAGDLCHTIVHRIFEAGLLLDSVRTIVNDPVAQQRLVEAIELLDGTIREIRLTTLGPAGEPRP